MSGIAYEDLKDGEFMTDFQFKALLRMFRDKVADKVELKKTPEEILKSVDVWLKHMGVETDDFDK